MLGVVAIVHSDHHTVPVCAVLRVHRSTFGSQKMKRYKSKDANWRALGDVLRNFWDTMVSNVVASTDAPPSAPSLRFALCRLLVEALDWVGEADEPGSSSSSHLNRASWRQQYMIYRYLQWLQHDEEELERLRDKLCKGHGSHPGSVRVMLDVMRRSHPRFPLHWKIIEQFFASMEV